MCVLIVCRVPDRSFPLLVAANREEDPMRPSLPPGLHRVDGRRVLCPLDRRYGGTWIGVNESGVVTALTNWAHVPADPSARSRGGAVMAALAAATAAEADQAVHEHVGRGPIRPFQLLIADADSLYYHRHAAEVHESRHLDQAVTIMTNRHAPETVVLPSLERWIAETGADDSLDVDARLDHLIVTLATAHGTDTETGEPYALCASEAPRPNERTTVSATILGVPRSMPGPLRMRFCPGNPRSVAFRDYSSLSHRLSDNA